MTDTPSNPLHVTESEPLNRLMSRLDFDDLEKEIVALAREEEFGSHVRRYQVITQLATMKRMDELVSQMIRTNKEIADSNDRLIIWGLVLAGVGALVSIFQILLLFNQVFRFVRF